MLLTQPTQSQEFPVPLVAGERALLRVFPSENDSSNLIVPEVRVRFYLDDQEIHSVDMPQRVLATPTLADPGNLASSSNNEIPGSVIQPGIELEIEIGSETAADATSDSTSQITSSERIPVEVHELPEFDLTLIPFVEKGSSDRSIVELINAMAENPYEHEMFEETRTLLPIAALNVTAHEPVTTSSVDGLDLLTQTSLIRAVEGGTGYYMGMSSDASGPYLGVAFISGRDSFSLPLSDTIAHELGHNLSLLHAPCGGPSGVDSSYPYSRGTVGSWGYDFRGGGSVVRRSSPDLMSYCRPRWISDYHFTNALRYRLFLENDSTRTVSAARPSLLVWGGKDANNSITLDPSFFVYAPPILPESDGEFEIRGQNSSGDELFSLSFDMQEIADAEENSRFLFVVPIQQDWIHELDVVALNESEEAAVVAVDNAVSMSLLRNPITRQIRGIHRAPRADAASRKKTIEEASETGFEVLLNRGSPEAATWIQ